MRKMIVSSKSISASAGQTGSIPKPFVEIKNTSQKGVSSQMLLAAAFSLNLHN
jgi:hypothetical protein